MRYPWVILYVVLIGVSAFPSAAFCDLKEDVYSRYESTVALIEKQNLQSDESAEIAGRMTIVNQALSSGNYAAANSQLIQIQSFIENKNTGISALNKQAKLQWLELYFDLFQKLIVIAFLAFLLIQPPSWRAALKSGAVSGSIRCLWAASGLILGVLFHLFDLSRYGNSVWAVFDIQLVFAVILGMIGGLGWGFFAALGMAGFRWFLQPEILSPPILIMTAGFFGIWAMKNAKDYLHQAKRGFLCGLIVGIFHGCFVYLPLAASLESLDLGLSIGLVAFFEAVAVAVFFGIISWILQGEVKKDMENELLKTRLLFLQAQLNPHFLFNALNTIAAICAKTGATIAESLIVKLSDFLRHILSRKEDRVTLREEMAFIEAYLSLEQARFGGGLKVEKDFQLSEAAWNTAIPLLILQPLVENAVKHGLRSKTGGGTLKLAALEKENTIEVRITDDGAGRPADFFADLLNGKTEQVDGTGIGLRNIQKRMQHIYGEENGLSFKSNLERGTQVTICFPLKDKK